MKAKAIQICGTGSGVGKSVIVAALCRIFLQDGFRVTPFKAQNMALNSFVTYEGGEIGRAQAYQAQAAKIKPSVDMNPILLKPTTDVGAQVIVKGKPIGNMSALKYADYKKHLQKEVKECFKRLSSEYEVIVIEGAGSPAEINLKAHDIVNMKMAKLAKAPVVLVGDIDKGGVFAWIIGTIELLNKKERNFIKGFIINKFRGDESLLKPGLSFLERKTGKKVLGVIPYFKDINLPEEDSIPERKMRPNTLKGTRKIDRKKVIKIEVICLPHISNFTDFDPLEAESDIELRYIRKKEGLDNPDIIIIPGTKNTISDCHYLYNSGYAKKIIGCHKKGVVIIGICGGYQMLGKEIRDPGRIESNLGRIKGLGLLDITTKFKSNKTLSQIKARELKTGIEIVGYEIHHGKAQYLNNTTPMFEIINSQGRKTSAMDGAISKDGKIWGTYIHGIFDNADFRREFLNRIRRAKGWRTLKVDNNYFDQNKEFDKLANLVRNNIDLKFLYQILEKRI